MFSIEVLNLAIDTSLYMAVVTDKSYVKCDEEVGSHVKPPIP